MAESDCVTRTMARSPAAPLASPRGSHALSIARPAPLRRDVDLRWHAVRCGTRRLPAMHRPSASTRPGARRHRPLPR